MTPPTTDTSREAVDRFAQWAEAGLDQPAADMFRALAAERDAALLREKSLKDNTEELRQLRREFNAVKAERDGLREAIDASQAAYVKIHDERDALRAQLAAARNEALEEAKAECETQRVKCNNHGQYEAAAFCKNLLIHISALKSTTPASREVTVQEAAQKAMTLMLEGVRKAALDTELGHSIIDDVFYPSIDGYIAQALAQEGQSDE